MTENNGSAGKKGGFGMVGLLGVVFITLKLVGVIDWSWWLVTLPFWGGLVIVIFTVTALFLFGQEPETME
jgi:hypothetical protein